MTVSRGQWLVGGLGLLIIGAVAGGLLLIGSPGEERARRMDQKRVDDLRSLTEVIHRYWDRHASLPGSLADLGQDEGWTSRLRDSATGAPYEYHQKDASTYELCAVFNREWSGGDQAWWHRAGRFCFAPTHEQKR